MLVSLRVLGWELKEQILCELSKKLLKGNQVTQGINGKARELGLENHQDLRI